MLGWRLLAQLEDQPDFGLICTASWAIPLGWSMLAWCRLILVH